MDDGHYIKHNWVIFSPNHYHQLLPCPDNNKMLKIKLTAASRLCERGVQERLWTMQYSLSVNPFETCKIASWQLTCCDLNVILEVTNLNVSKKYIFLHTRLTEHMNRKQKSNCSWLDMQLICWHLCWCSHWGHNLRWWVTKRHFWQFYGPDQKKSMKPWWNQKPYIQLTTLY